MLQHTLGDAPIEPKLIEMMNGIARGLDKVLNGEARGKDRKVGFVLLVFPYEGHEGRALFREMIARFEGQPEIHWPWIVGVRYRDDHARCTALAFFCLRV